MAIVIHEIKGNFYAYEHYRTGATVACDYLGRAGGSGSIYAGTKEYRPGEEPTIHEGTAHETGEEKTEKEILEDMEVGTEIQPETTGIESVEEEGIRPENGELANGLELEDDGTKNMEGVDTVRKPTDEERKEILETTQETVRQSGQSEPKLMKKGMQFIDILMNKMLPAAGKMKTNQPTVGSGSPGIQDNTKSSRSPSINEPAPEPEPKPDPKPEKDKQEGV